MQTLTVDFETFYDTDFSLSKRDMTVERYIRDRRFETIGVAVKVGSGPTQWFSGDMTETHSWLRQFDWANSALVCHNTMFDGAILNWRFGLRPKFLCDTLSMARFIDGVNAPGSLKALAERYGIGVKGTEVDDAKGKRRADFTPDQLSRYGEYCINDVELTYQLFQIMRPKIPVRELKLIDATLRLFTEPNLRLDVPLLQEHLTNVQAKRDAFLQAAAKHIDPNEPDIQKALRSNDKFAAVLRHLGVEPPKKTSLKTGKESYAFAKTDKDFQALLEHPDPRIQTLVGARLGVKSSIEETRTEAFTQIGQRGLLPIPLKYYGALTGRWSGFQNVNMQNLTRGGALRKSICALPGQVLIACDSANIELRVNHTLAGQADSVQAFKDKRDLYCEFASILFDREITKADKQERFLGKLSLLGLGYSMGAVKFRDVCRQNKIDLDETEAERVVALWRKTYDMIPSLWKKADLALDAMYKQSEMDIGEGGIVKAGVLPTGEAGFILPEGRSIRYPDLRRDERQWTYAGRGSKRIKLFGGKNVENIVQSLARHIIADQWLLVAAWLQKHAPRWRVVLQVHDELVLAGPKADAERVAEVVLRIMSTSPTWWPDVPLAAEASIAERYGDAK
jgi:DNA polymerase I-like protein with 3'-5' exonuclease and polymerase domains